jgi:SNF2 family DNA or RNA helicase
MTQEVLIRGTKEEKWLETQRHKQRDLVS